MDSRERGMNPVAMTIINPRKDYEQFLLFPQCFQKACFTGASKGVIVWEWVNMNLMYMVQVPFHQQLFDL